MIDAVPDDVRAAFALALDDLIACPILPRKPRLCPDWLLAPRRPVASMFPSIGRCCGSWIDMSNTPR